MRVWHIRYYNGIKLAILLYFYALTVLYFSLCLFSFFLFLFPCDSWEYKFDLTEEIEQNDCIDKENINLTPG
jgi:hypothetical protein